MAEASVVRDMKVAGLQMIRRASDRFSSDEFARWRVFLAWVARITIVMTILFELNRIGWIEVWRGRPTAWQFYALFGVSYLVLPVSDALIFKYLWHTDFWGSIGTFLRKRVLNSAFVGYSGEVVLLFWARKNVLKDGTSLAHDIKDSNILSAIVSTLVTVALILYENIDSQYHALSFGALHIWIIATLAMALVLPAGFIFRKSVVQLDPKSASVVFALHTCRFLLVQVLTLLQWKAALGQTEWSVLVTLLILQMLVSRIPLVPNRDFLFVGVALATCGALSLAPQKIAGLLIVSNALQLALHSVVLAGTGMPSFRRRRASR